LTGALRAGALRPVVAVVAAGARAAGGCFLGAVRRATVVGRAGAFLGVVRALAGVAAGVVAGVVAGVTLARGFAVARGRGDERARAIATDAIMTRRARTRSGARRSRGERGLPTCAREIDAMFPACGSSPSL
jgi:hypothetical protein